MTSDERKTLDALAATVTHQADQYAATGMAMLAESVRKDAAAIRAALAEVDALTQQVADLAHQVRDLTHADECHAKFYALLCDTLHVPEPHAVDGDVFDAIADLEARAIPKNACLHLANGTTIEEDEGVFLVWTRDDQRVTDPLPTLSAALSAAKEAP